MLFHTTTFALFFAAVWCGYWALGRAPRAQTGLLVLASWTFYGFWDWRFLGLLVGSTAVDYLVARRLGVTDDAATRRRLLGISIAVNLGVLGFFKYFDFFTRSFATAMAGLGFETSPFLLELVLPVGISFYTFQTLGYAVDVYRRRLEPEQDAVRFAAYVSFFPQLVAGPIERAERLLPQLAARRRLRMGDQLDGALIFCVGLFKKVVVADRLGPFVDVVFATPAAELGAADVALGAWAFAFQIYGDFSGYTDMAIGTARTLGIRLSENFHGPYFSRSPRELWQRWHVSLSTWLRDYLYVPLGGNRRGPARTALNLALTMLLGGLWHGAAWTFVGWGAFHGAWLGLHRLWLRARPDPGRLGPAWAVVAGIVTFQLVCVGWILFRAPDVASATGMLGRLATGSWGPAQAANGLYVLHHAWVAIGLQAVARFHPGLCRDPRHRPVLAVVAAYCLLSILTEGAFGEQRPFIYFQF